MSDLPPRLPDKPAAYVPSSERSGSIQSSFRSYEESYRTDPLPQRSDTLRLQQLLSSVKLDEGPDAYRPLAYDGPPEYLNQYPTSRRKSVQNVCDPTGRSFPSENNASMIRQQSHNAAKDVQPASIRGPIITPSGKRTYHGPNDFDMLLEQYLSTGIRPSLSSQDHSKGVEHERKPLSAQASARNSIISMASPALIPTTKLNIRIPSPPIRQDTASPSSSLCQPTSAAFNPHPSLIPDRGFSESPLSSPDIYSPGRSYHSPRTISALSRHSTKSPSPHRAKTPLLDPADDFYGSNRPGSVNRSTNSLPPTNESYATSSTTSPAVPEVQHRRGRPQGQNILEHDLPAMPALFNTEVHSLPRVPQTLASQSKSSLGTSTDRHPFSIPDPLQSVKLLRTRPIRSPPLCLEERFHPMAFAKTNKFKIKVHPAKDVFVAGGEIFGHFDLFSEEGFRAQLGSTQVLVGDIGVEVLGYEELQHLDSAHEPRALVIMHNRHVFQTKAEIHPTRAQEPHNLTNAVLNEPLPDFDGYRVPAKGITSFPFTCPLPVDAPSSVYSSSARIQYWITAYATVKLQGSEETIATTQAVRVVEAWDTDNPVYSEAIEATQGRDIANYHELACVARLKKSMYLEGETISGYIRVANHSARKTKDVKFSLVNKITFFGDKRSDKFERNPADDFSMEESVYSHIEPHIIPKSGEEVWNFKIIIPTEKCTSVRNCALFEVTPAIRIKISSGPLVKSTRLHVEGFCIANEKSTRYYDAPRSSSFNWSSLPTLFRFQRVIEGHPQPVQRGYIAELEPLHYIDAHERVTFLSHS